MRNSACVALLCERSMGGFKLKKILMTEEVLPVWGVPFCFSQDNGLR